VIRERTKSKAGAKRLDSRPAGFETRLLISTSDGIDFVLD